MFPLGSRKVELGRGENFHCDTFRVIYFFVHAFGFLVKKEIWIEHSMCVEEDFCLFFYLFGSWLFVFVGFSSNGSGDMSLNFFFVCIKIFNPPPLNGGKTASKNQTITLRNPSVPPNTLLPVTAHRSLPLSHRPALPRRIPSPLFPPSSFSIPSSPAAGCVEDLSSSSSLSSPHPWPAASPSMKASWRSCVPWTHLKMHV